MNLQPEFLLCTYLALLMVICTPAAFIEIPNPLESIRKFVNDWRENARLKDREQHVLKYMQLKTEEQDLKNEKLATEVIRERLELCREWEIPFDSPTPGRETPGSPELPDPGQRGLPPAPEYKPLPPGVGLDHGVEPCV
jgi:hypothetical protein